MFIILHTSISPALADNLSQENEWQQCCYLHIIIIIINIFYYFTPIESFNKWQQVYSSLQDPSQYSSRSW